MNLLVLLPFLNAIHARCRSGPQDLQKDFVIDYGFPNVRFQDQKAYLSLIKSPNGDVATGTRLSSVNQMLHGRFSARVSAVPVNGVITTFITMSDNGDEIDWEFVGGDKTSAQTNVFYKRIAEYGVRAGMHSTGDLAVSREYTIDWTSKAITWYINGNWVRTYSIDDPLTVTPMTPRGEKSYPVTPSNIQFGIWDAGSGPAGTSNWAGGRIPWGSATQFSAIIESVYFQCYDNNDQPVNEWPRPNPVRSSTDNSSVDNTVPNTASNPTDVKSTELAVSPPTNPLVGFEDVMKKISDLAPLDLFQEFFKGVPFFGSSKFIAGSGPSQRSSANTQNNSPILILCLLALVI
ncbi:concanavalin A-like lectin/glucanase domain-containing protein [Globomyces pollinis-pini]|nr:concanavalin A-like lectin/glucanase domain-containing protein [Globomyces pollinis-pini]KAJ3000473.1 hypothetical protein HDV02_005338 [Globomyces sp. JEL0801]